MLRRVCTKKGWYNLKPIKDFNSLQVGKKYFVISGIWSANLIYCGHVHNKRQYTFTFGNSHVDWINNFNICDYKSNLYIFEEVPNL